MTNTPSNSTPPFGNGDRVYCPRYAKAGRVIMMFPEYRQASVDLGDKMPYIVALSDLQSAPLPKPDRLTRARAALEAIRAERERTAPILYAALLEKDAAEIEAAGIAALPPMLVEMARELDRTPEMRWNYDYVMLVLARSHGVSPDVLRAAIGSES